LLTQGLVTSILPNLPMGRRGAQGGNNPIIEAVHKFLATAGRDGAPSRIVLWSDRGIETSLARETTLPVTRLTPQSLGVGLPEGSGETAPIDSVAGAVGPLLKGVKLQNLLAGGVHPRPRRPLLFSGVLALAIVAVAAVYFLMPLYFEGKRLQEIDRQIALRKNAMRRIEVIRDANERQKAEIEAIRGFRRDGVRTLTMMRELCSLLPKTVWLTRLKASDASVEMEGYAKSTADVLARLKSSTTFRKAELASPPVRDLIMDRDRFVMKIEMEGFHRNELGKEKTRQTQR